MAGGGGQSAALSVAAGNPSAAVLSVCPDAPAEVHLLDLDTGASRPLTQVSRKYLSQHHPARLEKFSIRRGPQEIECRLWLPPDFDPSVKHPLVLDVHGGPNGAFYDAFNAVQQVLATGGFPVLAVNPRGSSTYGQDFMMAVLEGLGRGGLPRPDGGGRGGGSPALRG